MASLGSMVGIFSSLGNSAAIRTVYVLFVSEKLGPSRLDHVPPGSGLSATFASATKPAARSGLLRWAYKQDSRGADPDYAVGNAHRTVRPGSAALQARPSRGHEERLRVRGSFGCFALALGGR
jgi:hypothetical protein